MKTPAKIVIILLVVGAAAAAIDHGDQEVARLKRRALPRVNDYPANQGQRGVEIAMITDQTRMVVVPRSGIGKPFATVSREAAYDLCDELRPDSTRLVAFDEGDRRIGFQPVREDSASRLSANGTTGLKPAGHDRQDAYPPLFERKVG